MLPEKLSENLFYVGVNDRTTEFFERMISLPYGVSYNSYLLVDEKVALFDTVENHFAEQSLSKIKYALNGRKIDYLVIHHIEPDHTSGIKNFLAEYPDIQIVCNKKAAAMLDGFYGISQNILLVEEKQELLLGAHTLRFLFAPMVHWPEVMMTYETSEKILFSADAFGCFGTLDGAVEDSKLNVEKYFSEMERYYVNIIGKYGVPVQTILKKLADFHIDTICSLHGPVWRENKAKVIEIYDKLSKHEGENGVVVVYGSMYSHTEMMAEMAARGAAEITKNVILHDVSKSDISQIITDIFKYKGLIIGAPTYNGDIFPNVKDVLERLEIRGLKNRIFGSFGCFTWAGQAVKILNAFAEKMQWENIGSAEVKQSMQQSDYQTLIELGRAVAQKVLK
ncbi:MAG: FprA family A-type flavoprotein [Prevotellaceae bacterium]|jgi:flavorubredoxin|nr:FprA family A-type flavoprotein [Prevotellaceae bacterium]